MSGVSSFLPSFFRPLEKIAWAFSRESVLKMCKHSQYCHPATFHSVIVSLKTYGVFLKASAPRVMTVCCLLRLSAMEILILRHFADFTCVKQKPIMSLF